MAKITALIALVLLTLAAVGTIVGFSTFWYRIKTVVDDGADIQTVIIESKYNAARLTSNGTSITEGYTSEAKDNMTTSLKFFKTALAMDILAFVNLFFAVIGVGIAAFKEMTAANQLKVKNSVNGAFIFLIIAVFVFLGLPKAMKDDCRASNNGSSSTDECDLPFYNKFQGTYSSGNGTLTNPKITITYGPTTSWIGATVALGLTFFATILVNCAGALAR